MSDPTTIADWGDANSVRVLRAQTVPLDGVLVGKHLSPKKFLSGAESGWGFADVALAVDLANSPQLGFDFGDWRGEMRDDPEAGPRHDRTGFFTARVSPR